MTEPLVSQKQQMTTQNESMQQTSVRIEYDDLQKKTQLFQNNETNSPEP